jgi:hypothetical protein
MEDAEREYVEAKAAYDVALARLVAARKARPKQPTKAELRTAENQRIADAVWQAYLDGKRDRRALAEEFGRSRQWIGNTIWENLSRRAFGPETIEEHEERIWWLTRADRAKAQIDAMLEEGRRMSLEPGRSEAWLRAYQMLIDSRPADPE